jgi:hypothetical protein
MEKHMRFTIEIDIDNAVSSDAILPQIVSAISRAMTLDDAREGETVNGWGDQNSTWKLTEIDKRESKVEEVVQPLREWVPITGCSRTQPHDECAEEWQNVEMNEDHMKDVSAK